MAVLSTYLTDIQGSIDENGNSLRHTRPIMCNTYYEGGSQGMHLRHGSQPERIPSITGTPQLQPWYVAAAAAAAAVVVVFWVWRKRDFCERHIGTLTVFFSCHTGGPLVIPFHEGTL